MTSGSAANRPVLFATGVGGGLMSGLLGGGGGAIMIPLMTGVLKMRQHTAHGTSLVIIAFAALASAITYSFKSHVDLPLVGYLLAGSIGGAYLGARLAGHLDAMRLRQCLGLFLLLICARLLLLRHLDPLFGSSGTTEALAGAGIGLAGGLASGALGVGGGAIFVPAMVLLLGTEQHTAQGISLWVIVFSAVVGASTHYRQGTVDLVAARWIAPVAVPAGIAGSLVAAAMSQENLQTTFAIVLLLIGLQMLLTATLRLRNPAAQGAPAALGADA